MANDTLATLEENKVKQVFYAVVFVLGTVGNVLVIIVVAGRRERRTVNDIFIVNLAISDLTYLFLCLPTKLYQTLGEVPSEFYCRFVWPMMTVTICLSIFTLTSMAVHRCTVILNPFQPEIKHRYVVVWIIGIWVLGLLVVVPLIIVTTTRQVKPYGCEEKWPSIKYRKAYTACLFVAQYALPLAIIAVEYVRIGIDLFRPKGRPKVRGDSRRERAKRDPARRKENMQVIKTLATIVILFALSMLPAQLSWMLIDFGGENDIKVGQAFLKICEWLLYTHACLNPIVYGSLTKHYRRAYIKYLTLIFCCRWNTLYRSLSSSMTMRSSSPVEDPYLGPVLKAETERCGPFGACIKHRIVRRENSLQGQNGHVIEQLDPTIDLNDNVDNPPDHVMSQNEHLIDHNDHVTDSNDIELAEEPQGDSSESPLSSKETTL